MKKRQCRTCHTEILGNIIGAHTNKKRTPSMTIDENLNFYCKSCRQFDTGGGKKHLYNSAYKQFHSIFKKGRLKTVKLEKQDFNPVQVLAVGMARAHYLRGRHNELHSGERLERVIQTVYQSIMSDPKSKEVILRDGEINVDELLNGLVAYFEKRTQTSFVEMVMVTARPTENQLKMAKLPEEDILRLLELFKEKAKK